MSGDSVSWFMVFFWEGFSLSYLLLTWARRLSRESSVRDKVDSKLKLPRTGLPMRLGLTVIGLVGLGSAISLFGIFKYDAALVSLPCLVGVVAGTLISFRMGVV